LAFLQGRSITNVGWRVRVVRGLAQLCLIVELPKYLHLPSSGPFRGILLVDHRVAEADTAIPDAVARRIKHMAIAILDCYGDACLRAPLFDPNRLLLMRCELGQSLRPLQLPEGHSTDHLCAHVGYLCAVGEDKDQIVPQ